MSDPKVILQMAMRRELRATDLRCTHAAGGEQPWSSIYPLPGLKEALLRLLDRTRAQSVHYLGLCDVELLRSLVEKELRVSALDLFGSVERNADLTPALRQVLLYGEGSPSDAHVWIQDVHIGYGDHPLQSGRRRANLRGVILVEQAIPDLERFPEFEWRLEVGFVCGVRRSGEHD